jgi:hypothetical protein
MFRKFLYLAGALALLGAGLFAGLMVPRPHWPALAWPLPGDIVVGGRGPAAGPAHAHAGPTIEQVRALSALTVLELDVADVQVTDLRGYTGGARAALVVKGDVTLASDLAQARFASVDHTARAAVLVLPPPRAGNARVDHARTRLIGVWRDGLWQMAPGGDAARAALVNQAYAEAQRVVAEAGQSPELDRRARAQAESVLKAFFGAMGWTLTVRWSDRTLVDDPAPPPTRPTSEAAPPTLPVEQGGRMPSDQQVGARHVLQSLMKLKRQGLNRAMAELEQLEPDLAGYLMEELSLVQQKLLELGAPAGRTRWLVRRVESTALVCVLALREAHYDLWRRDVHGPLARLDPEPRQAGAAEEGGDDPLAPGSGQSPEPQPDPSPPAPPSLP